MQGRGKAFVYRPEISASDSAEPRLFTTHTGVEFKRAKPFKRSKSYLTLFNPKTDSQVNFAQHKPLGYGTYGQAYECRWKDFSLVEKKPHPNQIYYSSITDMEIKIEALMREANLMGRAYSSNASTALIIWPTFPTPEDHSMPVTLDFRLITKFIPGRPIHQNINGTIDIDYLAVIFYHAAVALNHLHEKGIIHGDVSPNNTLVSSDLSVHYIDFGMARLAGDLVETFPMSPRKANATYIAPERINTEFAVAHSSQDIFSLAYTFHCVIINSFPLEIILDFYERYPCIENFIANGFAHNPEERPLLPDFISELHQLLAIPLLKLWLKLFSDEDVEKFLSNRLDQFTDTQLTHLVFSLLQAQNDRAEFLIECLCRHQPDYCKDGLFDLFRVIAELNLQMKRIHSGVFHEVTRKKIIGELSVAFDFARDWMENPGEIIHRDLADRIKRIPVLNAIYENIPEHEFSYSEDLFVSAEDTDRPSSLFSPSM